MAYLSLYRKYRSQTFGDLIGQDHVVRTLQQGIASERIAHSYLFTGPRGTGKTSSARLLAKALCCEKGPIAEPCNECEICVSITEGSCMDVYEFDAASESGVDEIRETIVNVVDYKPAIARFKVFIIDEVHDLSAKAFDALLKTIEEPPSHIIFILATTEFIKVPTTIRSRCQKFEFHRASMQDLIGRLKFVAEAEGVTVEPGALSAMAQMADGGYRDALTLLEQAILTSEGTITLQHVYDQLGLVAEETVDQILEAMSHGDHAKTLSLLSELARLGRDPRSILESILHRLSDLTRAIYSLEANDGDAARDALAHEVAVRLGINNLLNLRAAISESHRAIRDVTLPRIWMESDMIRISQSLAAPAGKTPPVQKPVEVKPAEQPEAKVQPVERVTEVSPTAVIEEVESSGDPLLVKARAKWQHVLASLPAKSPIQLKLERSEVSELDHSEAVIHIARAMDYDWLISDPKRIGYITKLARENGMDDFTLRFAPAAKKKLKATPDETAVELPAEGHELVKLVKATFET